MQWNPAIGASDSLKQSRSTRMQRLSDSHGISATDNYDICDRANDMVDGVKMAGRQLGEI